jgi:hypothetical protein
MKWCLGIVLVSVIGSIQGGNQYRVRLGRYYYLVWCIVGRSSLNIGKPSKVVLCFIIFCANLLFQLFLFFIF